MRTTIDIPDPLYRDLKAKAASQGRTVKDLILRGVEKEMAAEIQPKRRIQFPLIRGKGTRKINITNAEIEEALFG